MRLGLFSWYGFQYPIDQRLRNIVAAGFQSTMLWWDNESQGGPGISLDVVKHARDLGLEIENIHVPFEDSNRLWSTDAIERAAFLRAHRTYVRRSAECEVPGIVMHISKGYDVTQPNEYGLECMMALLENAKECGVWLAIENTRRVNLVEAILDRIRDARLGLCYDTSHGQLYEQPPFGLLRKYPDRLKCLHLSDNDGLTDKHWRIGEGVINWEEFIRAFPRRMYEGDLSLEVYPHDEFESEVIHLSRAFDGISRLRSRLESEIN